MAMLLTSENVNKDFEILYAKENFYKPLCLDGYLTPLQRKKLREKRNCHSVDIVDSEKPIDLKKSRPCKQKKERLLGLFAKSKKQLKKKRSKETVTKTQYPASKIILRTLNIDGNTKKFFKAPSENRLEKANFSMPFFNDKNEYLKIKKFVKENICYSRKQLPNRENSVHLNDINENVKLSPAALESEKNSSSSCKCVSPIESKMSEIHDANEGSSEDVSNTPKEKSVFDFDWPEDELLLKRQEKARAVVRMQRDLKDPQKVNTSKEPSGDAQEEKLFPIFYIAKKKQVKSKQEMKNDEMHSNLARYPVIQLHKLKNVPKKLKDVSKNGEQMIIDAGQREIGAKICATCNMVYTIAQEEDERLHSSYHNTYLINLKFPGWKEENVIGEYADGRIILVKNNDKSVKLKKIEDILIIANRDLGFPSSLLPVKPDLTFVLFISCDKQVAGCVIAEPISSACQVLLDENESPLEKQSDEKSWRIGNWYSSSETQPAICGINRIWVAHTFRRQKIASRMLDCLRSNFIHGHIVSIQELAFTDPSPDGREFAASYTGISNFLVYK